MTMTKQQMARTLLAIASELLGRDADNDEPRSRAPMSAATRRKIGQGIKRSYKRKAKKENK